MFGKKKASKKSEKETLRKEDRITDDEPETNENIKENDEHGTDN